jgi:hypothetical protein
MNNSNQIIIAKVKYSFVVLSELRQMNTLNCLDICVMGKQTYVVNNNKIKNDFIYNKSHISIHVKVYLK